MKLFSILFGACFFLLGCSQSVVQPGNETDALPKVAAYASNQWIWGQYTIIISADRTQAELMPLRESSFHINVTKFVEGPPCPDCLWIGKSHLTPGGTILVKVNLRHPFYGHTEYTGFDVRGIVVFQTTDYMKIDQRIYETDDTSTKLMDPVLLNFSDPVKGGAALINADGYTFYLNPLLNFKDRPWLNYSKGNKAYGDAVDCTVNPYKLFADKSPRRMFKTTDFFTRTYHIKPPEGPGAFEFGYVVSACWVKPDKTPVTNPETDFRVEANCEDPYEISAVQLMPLNYDVGNQPLFKVRVKHRIGEWPAAAYMVVPSLSSDPLYNEEGKTDETIIRWKGHWNAPEDVNFIDDETTEFVMRIDKNGWEDINACLVPGVHLGILDTGACGKDTGYGEGYDSQLYYPKGVQPVYVNVVL